MVVETVTGSTVRTFAVDIVQSREYEYYYLFSESPTRAILVQSDSKINNNTIINAWVSDFRYEFDQSDNLTDWRLYSYPAAVYVIDNSESYVVYTNMLDNYPVLRGEPSYATSYYIAGFGLLSCALTCFVFMLRIFRINHS